MSDRYPVRVLLQLASRLVVLCLLPLIPAAAQTTGELRGLLLDPSGATVASASVSLTSDETGAARVTRSDAEGRFGFALLPVGSYSVTVDAPGFRTATASATVRAGEVAAARLHLQIGQRNESMTINDAVTPLDTENAQLHQTIYGDAIQSLPVQRNANLFALTLPGVVPVVPNLGFLGSGSFTSNGGRGRANNVTVDNIVSTDVIVTGTAGPLETTNFSQIKEVKIITSNFSAEYGRNSSSQVVYITKSGTNQLHGELYDYLQNDKLNARPWFDASGKSTGVRRNQYGYALGGPVWIPKAYDGRNRTFFFTSYEGQKRRGVGDVRVAQVPSPAMLATVTDPGAKARARPLQTARRYQHHPCLWAGAAVGQRHHRRLSVLRPRRPPARIERPSLGTLLAVRSQRSVSGPDVLSQRARRIRPHRFHRVATGYARRNARLFAQPGERVPLRLRP